MDSKPAKQFFRFFKAILLIVAIAGWTIPTFGQAEVSSDLIPWWKSNLAILIYILSTLGLAYIIYRFQLQLQLQKQESARLQELDAFKDRFYTNITHEFRTPLSVIEGVTHRIQGHRTEKELILRNSNNLLDLVNQMLDLRKIESGKMPLKMVQGDIIRYLRYLLESFYPLAEDKGVDLHFLSSESSLMMDYDKEKLVRIISNLLSNAIKFTPKEGNVYLTVDGQRTTEKGNRLFFSIRDTGIGISEEKLPAIFDRFYQVQADSNAYQNRDKSKGEGTGIGLALTRELVHLLEGEISVESKKDKGTIFKLNLPIQKMADVVKEDLPELSERNKAVMDAVQQTTGAEKKTKRATTYRVLIIEDNPDIISLVTSLLEEDYKIFSAPDGEAGIKKAIELVPDLIISDIMMPKKDGYEVCQTLKEDERTSHIPIVMLTAKGDIDSRLTGLKHGADAYLAKPFHQEELFVRIEKLLNLRKRLQERYQSFNSLPPAPEPELQQEDAFIKKVRKTVEKRMKSKDFSTPELSKALGMSRSQLHNKLKALTDTSTSHFIRKVRLQRAKELLQSTDLKVVEISDKVGFSHTSYFTRLFSEEFGAPPSEFRN